MYLAIPSQYLSIYLYLCEFKSASFHLSIFVYLVYVSIRSGVAATFSLGFTWVGSPSKKPQVPKIQCFPCTFRKNMGLVCFFFGGPIQMGN